MSYIIKTASTIASVQTCLDKHASMTLIGYAINKEGLHCLIFKS